jgi:hypothetical protein
MPFILLISLLLISAVACHILAKSKGGNPVTWGAAGIVFGPLAVIYFLFFK